MAGGIMIAPSLQHRSFSPCLLLSTTTSSSSSSNSSSISLCSSSSISLCSTSQYGPRGRCLTQRLLAVGARTPAVARAVASFVEEEENGDDDLSLYEEELGLQDEEELGLEDEEAEVPEQNVSSRGAKVKRTFRLLGNKEKKELRAYAHQLGNDICIHQVGKWGLTANCIIAISDALEANELVKIRVLDNLDEELSDTANELEEKTGAQIVGKMGRTLLLYRPSMRKLKAAQAAEEKAYRYQKRKNLLASRTRSSRSFPGAARGKR